MSAPTATPHAAGLGTLAWAIGSTEAEHAPWPPHAGTQHRKKTICASPFDGRTARPGSYAKRYDSCTLIAQHCANGGGRLCRGVLPAAHSRTCPSSSRMTLATMGSRVLLQGSRSGLPPTTKTIDYVTRRPLRHPNLATIGSKPSYWEDFAQRSGCTIRPGNSSLMRKHLRPSLSWGIQPGTNH